MTNNNELPDMQETEPAIKIPIKQVGVENVQVPFQLESKYGGSRDMLANVSMRTDCDAKSKGVSMSRFIRTLKNYLNKPLKQTLIYEILHDISENVGSENAYIKFDFDLPITRKSVKSDNEFPIFHKCRFEGRLKSLYEPTKLEKRVRKIKFSFYQGVQVQYASYCPCSAELSNHLSDNGSKGFPHAQRSFADILIKSSYKEYIWLEDLIEAVEKSIKTLPYPIIKREDEQRIAEIAAQNPIFVEDAIRQISQEIDSINGVVDWIIKCSHEESIHTSEAIAMNYKGIDGGFDGRYFL